MNKLAHYKKNKIGEDGIARTSVVISKKQKAFVDKNNVNLSEVTRDAVAALMSQKKVK